MGLAAGWLWLHTHAFLADPEDSVGDLLLGLEAAAGRGFAMAAPVWVPPWPFEWRHPNDGTKRTVIIPKEATRYVFFHDVQVDGGEVRTANLGGLVGVVRGMGRTPLGATPPLA